MARTLVLGDEKRHGGVERTKEKSDLEGETAAGIVHAVPPARARMLARGVKKNPTRDGANAIGEQESSAPCGSGLIEAIRADSIAFSGTEIIALNHREIIHANQIRTRYDSERPLCVAFRAISLPSLRIMSRFPLHRPMLPGMLT
jgi:hypothetical protein